MAITLTENAARHVAAHLAKRGKGIGLRLGVRTSGCSGLAYKLEYADDVRPEDAEFESHGVRVVDLNSRECVEMLSEYIASHPDVWNEDIGELPA